MICNVRLSFFLYTLIESGARQLVSIMRTASSTLGLLQLRLRAQ